MSLHRHNDFLLRENMEVAGFKQIGIPDDLDDHEKVQPYGFAVGMCFDLLNRELSKRAPCVVLSFNDHDGLGGTYLVQHRTNQQTWNLTHWQISQLERQGRFIPFGPVKAGQRIESSQAMTPWQEKVAKKKLGYVIAAIKLHGKGTVLPPKKVILRAADQHAEKQKEKRPCYRVLKEAIENYIESPFNRLLGLVPGNTRGNHEARFSRRLEDVLQLAVEHAWKMPKGTAKTVTRRFARLLTLPEYADVRAEACDADGNIVKPSQPTIERRFYAVDYFNRTLLRHGPEAAKRTHDIRIPQLLPTAPLMCVDVDYTTLDASVFHPKWHFVYGRPSIIIFHDRYSSTILGRSVFFGKPNFEAFLAGLKNAIYPKDMSAFPGLQSDIYGVPITLCVDAESHLVSDEMHAACDEIGMILHELLPGEPNSKGSMERSIRTLNDTLIHNIPGTTHSNHTLKDEFDAEKELGVPHISMDELERHLTAWEWDYNNSSHRGIGFLRTLKGVPAQLFAEGMDDVGQRFPIDPEVFARVAGNVHWAAIEDGCIVWDHIKYSSPALVHLSLNPKSTPPPRMKARKSRRNTTLYRCTRDPSDIGGIWVRVPGTGKSIFVPAAQGYIDYASGLRLYQHKEAIKHHNKHHKRPIANVNDLDVALAARAEDLKDIYEERKLQGTADKLAGFFRGIVNKVRRSRLYVPVPSEERSAHRIDDPKAGQPLKKKRVSQASPDYDPKDSPEKIFTRDEHGRLVPGEPLMKMKTPHKRKTKEVIEPGEKVGTRELAEYEDPDDISDILARRAEARRNRKK